jgi:tagatose 6-phosphate kinase
MIVVVSLNPALDITHRVDHADWSGVNRPADVQVRPGGKGVNVARVLTTLGADVLLTGLVGGAAGNSLRAELSARGVDTVMTEIAGETRRTFAVVDAARGDTALFNEPGPAVTAEEYARFRDMFAAQLAGATALVLSGSLPSGMPAGTYADLIALASCSGVPALLDTSGEALVLGAAAGPEIVKPNLAELHATAERGMTATTPEEGSAARADRPACGERAGWPDPASSWCCGPVAAAAKAADTLRGAGASAVVVTLGSDGLLALTSEESWHARPQPVSGGNPTGAGDAAAAGLAHGLASGRPWRDRVAHAAALGAAAVTAPVAGELDLCDYHRALAGVQVGAARQRWH